jgi:predicted peptidase
MLTPTGQTAQSLETVITKTINGNYLLYLPPDYNQSSKTWPLMMFLHGSGERGNDLEKVKMHGPPKLVAQGKDFPFIIVSPQCPDGIWWDTDFVITLLDTIIDRYHVDTSRVYLTGLSMGGFGTWETATKYPDRFAAIAPICGGGNPFLASRLKDVPVWCFHGEKDQAVPFQRSVEMVEALKKVGGDVRFTAYPDAGHDSWTVSSCEVSGKSSQGRAYIFMLAPI